MSSHNMKRSGLEKSRFVARVPGGALVPVVVTAMVTFLLCCVKGQC